MLKILKKLLIFIVFVVVLMLILGFFLAQSIRFEVTSDDLPLDVYETSGEILPFAKIKILALLTADEAKRYTLTEEIINLIILDSIRENINADYDPLGDCDTSACLLVTEDDNFAIDYIYAKLNDDQQLVLTISAYRDRLFDLHTALILTFDISFDLLSLNPSMTLTLDNYALGDQLLSLKWLDWLLDSVDRDSIEESASFGSLNLTDYTYTIEITDAF